MLTDVLKKSATLSRWKKQRVAVIVVVLLVLVIVHWYIDRKVQYIHIREQDVDRNGQDIDIREQDVDRNGQDIDIREQEVDRNGQDIDGTGNNSDVHEANALLMNTHWPRRLLFIWCGARKFSLLNYLSLQSAIRSINPTALMFAYKKYPDTNEPNYSPHAWLADLQDHFPFWIKQRIVESDNLCRKEKTSISDIELFLDKHDFRGCLYISRQTVLVEPFVIHNADTTLNYYDTTKQQGFIYIPRVANAIINGTCVSVRLSDGHIPEACFVLDPLQLNIGEEHFDAERIMFNPTAVSSQLRLILYGSREMPHHKPDSLHPAPNIAHYAWLGGGNMSYTFYMSILSALYLGRVEHVYIHGDTPLAGELVTQLHAMDISQRVHYVQWHRPTSIFGHHVNVIQNQADLVKSSVMWTHGGILMDPDLMFVRAPDPEMFHYEALVMGGGRPYMLNPSVAISKPRSEYSRLWLESEKNFSNGKYVWNCCFKTYKIWERNPRIAKVVRNFNLVCWRGYCYPMWLDRRAKLHGKVHLMENVDWRKDIVTAHFADANPYHSYEQCAFHLSGLVGELGRMILRAAGLLGPDEGLVP